MKRSKTLRSQITTTMSILVALQSLALIVALFVSQVFTIVDTESVRLFLDTSDSRAESFNKVVGELVSNTARQTERVSNELQALSRQTGVAPESLLSGTSGEQAANLVAENLMEYLGNNNVTGAFVMLQAPVSADSGSTTHSSVYIRDALPYTTVQNYQGYILEHGPMSVASEFDIPLSSNWQLDYAWKLNSDTSFYQKPFEAQAAHPGSEIQRYGYWSNPQDLLGDGQRVVTYTMPLLDAAGIPYGVFGLEMTLSHLTGEFLPAAELPYQPSFYAIAGVSGDTIDLDWFIPGGAMAQTYLQDGVELILYPTGDERLISTELPGMGEMYCTLRELQLYSDNSPYNQTSWTLIAFVGADALNETGNNVVTLLIGSIALTTVIAFLAVILLSRISTRKIQGLSGKIRSKVNNYDTIAIEPTGMSEIDELLNAVEKLNQSVMESSRRMSDIIELTDMPIGCFQVLASGGVFLTDQVYNMLDLPSGAQMSRQEWNDLLKSITSHPQPDTDHTYRLDGPDGPRWLRILQHKDGDTSVGILLDVSDDIRQQLRLSKQLDYDAMTGLYNRNAFKREAYARILKDPSGVGCMIFADLDNLKFINDTYGHESGDRLLRLAGGMFSELVQHGAVVARIAGDEFAIYLHSATMDQAEIRDTVMSIFAKFDNRTMTTGDGSVHRIRFSGGMAWYPTDSYNVNDLLKLSDYAMYEAKHQRKGTVAEFNPNTYKETAYILENSESISRLLDERLIRFDFQPIVDMRTGEIHAYEALMRSKLPEFETPSDILSVATSQSKLYQLENLVYTEVFSYVNTHREEIPEDTLVFVNSLPSQRLSQRDVDWLAEEYPLALPCVVFEITEDENTPIELIKEKAAVIRGMGNRIAIDDFGSGYSNELRMLSLNPDYVKIDMGIVQNIANDRDKQTLVSNIVSFCAPKGILTIAEGVENAQDALCVKRLGINLVQGFFTGKPDPAFLPPKPRAVALIREAEGIHQHI